MSIKLKLALQFSVIVAGILIFSFSLVYYFSYSSQSIRFRESLFVSAKNTATLLINTTEADSTLLKKVLQFTSMWDREELAITDSAFNLVYANNVQYLSHGIKLGDYVKDDLNFFSILDKDGFCFEYIDDNKKYYIFALAYDNSKTKNLSELRKILLLSVIISLVVSVLLSYIFSNRAIEPLKHIINNVKKINSNKLSERLPEGNKKDEIAQLAMTFNEMLNKLEVTFKNQKDFISHTSHELRTPLTVMIAQSEYLLSHERSIKEYISHITETISDLKNFNYLINNLLELAQLDKDDPILYSRVRVDEIILNSILNIKSKYKNRRIISRSQYPEDENHLIIYGNEGLLTIVFRNILDNACKFSKKDVIVEFQVTEISVDIIVSDSGIGIPPNEIDSIYRPFARASNARFIGGLGIGLSLVSKILELHNASMNIESILDAGTRVNISFRRK